MSGPRASFRNPITALEPKPLDRCASPNPETRPDVVCLVREEGLQGSCHEAARLPGTWGFTQCKLQTLSSLELLNDGFRAETHIRSTRQR